VLQNWRAGMQFETVTLTRAALSAFVLRVPLWSAPCFRWLSPSFCFSRAFLFVPRRSEGPGRPLKVLSLSPDDNPLLVER